jgi:integrase/recombinase XerD
MSPERGLSAETIRGRRYRAADFLKWYGGRHRRFREVRLTDIEAYINRNSARGWSLVTRHSESSFLRAFFRHAESRGWCRTGIASAIQARRAIQTRTCSTTRLIGHLRRDAYLLAAASCSSFATVFSNQLRTLAWSL